MGEWENGYNIVGFAGGVILAAALLPQIYLAHQRKSTEDISYVWQVSCLSTGRIGLCIVSFLNAYFGAQRELLSQDRRLPGTHTRSNVALASLSFQSMLIEILELE